MTERQGAPAEPGGQALRLGERQFISSRDDGAQPARCPGLVQSEAAFGRKSTAR